MATATESKMMVIACPGCAARVAVDAFPEPGEQYACPHCDATFAARYQAGEHHEQAFGEASSQALPARDDQSEQEVLMLRPSLWRWNPLAFAGLWCSIIGGSALAIKLLIAGWSAPVWVAVLVVVVAAAVVLGWWKISTMGTYVRVTSKRLIDCDGFLRRRTSEILHRDIKNVRVEQTLWQRLMDVGTLSIYTNSDEAPEVHMEHVPGPGKVRAIIDGYRSL
jgi:hypothetical protein